MKTPEKKYDDLKRPCYRDTNLQIIFCITLISVLGVTSITPAFPKMVQVLKITPQEVGLLISVFALPGVLFTLILGIIADRIGRKTVLVPMLILYGIAGTACAFARDFNLLLILRFIQGIGMAFLYQLGVTVIGDLYSGKERTAAMGYNAGFFNVGATIFPVIGGALAILGWYYPFFLSIIAVPVGFLVLFSLKNPEPTGPQHLRVYLKGAWQIAKNRQVIELFIIIFVAHIVVFGPYFTYFPLFIGNSFAASPFIIGVIMASMSIVGAIVSSQIGKLSKIHSEKKLIMVAFIFYTLALTIVPSIQNLWLLLIPSMIFGIAQGISWPCIRSLLVGAVSQGHRAALMSLDGTVSRVGATLGPIISGVILGILGMASIFYFGAVLSVAMFLLALIIFLSN